MAQLRARLRCLLALAYVMAPTPACADIDAAEYETRGALNDRKAQEAFREQIARDRAAEDRREAERSLRARQAEEQRRLADAARPWPERLTELRCTKCHDAGNYRDNAHTLLGWWIVGLRMTYVNKAPLSPEDLRTIVPYLARTYPSRGIAGALEWILGLLALVAPASLIAWLVRRRRRSAS